VRIGKCAGHYPGRHAVGAGCHNPGFARRRAAHRSNGEICAADDRAISPGKSLFAGKGRTRAKTVFRPPDVGFQDDFLRDLPSPAWGDGLPRVPTLESVAFTPLSAAANMGRNEQELLRDIAQNAAYPADFDRVFGGEGVSRATVERALATYERTIVPASAPFDRWIAGDEAAIPETAKRGFDLFTGRAKCGECRATWRFTGDSFHDIGTGGDNDFGRGRLFPKSQALQHAFKVPSLRDVARCAPYMQDGSLPTLEAVIALYDRGGVARPSHSEHIQPLQLTGQERDDLIAFLQTLTGDAAQASSPVIPAR